MSKKTNAARILDRAKISYELMAYDLDESEFSAVAVAKNVGMSVTEIYKTLVARGDKNGILLACIPANHELNLKLLAQASGNKKVELVPLKEVQPLTGYIRGGVSPLGTKKKYPVYFHEDVKKHEKIAISAGTRGLQIYANAEDLIRVTEASIAPISSEG